MRSWTRLLLFALSFVMLFAPDSTQAQAYTRIVVFGDSLSDTGNVARLVQNKYGARLPAPAFGYTDGRFTDGTDTLPSATLYTGIWIEQLAATLAARPAIKASLDGGTDYAYGDATTAAGTRTSTYGSTGLSVTVNNIGQQVTDYLATSPTVNSSTLYVVWGGANDLLAATSSTDITNAAANEIAVVQRLINAGATDFLIPNLPPLGAIPRLNGDPVAAAQASAAAQVYGAALFAGLQTIPGSNPGKTLRLFPLDVFGLFGGVIAAPSANALDNVTAKSQFALVNPDRYLFWDDLHPTTAGHHLLALAAAKLITPVIVTTTTSIASSSLNSNLGASVTFTATVAAASGSPTGTVTFLDGAATLGTATLSSTGATSATASFTTSALSASTHSITAAYAANGSFAASTSAAITQAVTAPAVSFTASPTSLTITRGSSGTTTITATPVGGQSGTVTLACGTLPAKMTCTFSPATLTLTGSNTMQSSTLTLGTQTMSALVKPRLRPDQGWEIACALLVPGFLTLGRFRRSKTKAMYGLLALLCFGVFCTLGLTGCAGSDTRTPAGAYTVPVNITTGSTTSTINLQVTVQ